MIVRYTPARDVRSFKWSTIKRAKGITEAKRGALFTKVAREISVAARQGGGDPDANYRLRLADREGALGQHAADNIKRTIDKATGGGERSSTRRSSTRATARVAWRPRRRPRPTTANRTAAEVRSMFSKTGGQLAGSGAVAWQFEPRGLDHRRARGRSTPTRSPGRDRRRRRRTSTRPATRPSRIYTSPGDLEAVRQALEAPASPSSRPSRR
jgi:hypothetical protein